MTTHLLASIAKPWAWLRLPLAAAALSAVLAPPAAAQLDVTFVGNNGVLLNAGGQSVMIDTLWNHTDNFWTHLETSVQRNDLFTAQAPFDDVRFALTTHNHPDHFNATRVSNFLNASPQTEWVGPPQARASVSDRPQELDINPVFQTDSVVLTSPGIEIEVFHMEHFDQFGNDFSRVQDYTYLVTMGGVKLLHLGDVDYIPENFAAFDFSSREIDAVVLPTFNTLLSIANRQVILDQIAPRNVIATHLRAGVLASEEANVRALYPDATIFTTPFDSITLPRVPEPGAAATAALGLMALLGRRRR